ncbi:MAG: type III pantothenate kinase [Leptospirales bacterium]
MGSEKVVSIKVGVSRMTVALHDRSGKIQDLLVWRTPKKISSVQAPFEDFQFPKRWGKIFEVVLISVVPQLTAWLKVIFASNPQMTLHCPSEEEWGVVIDYFPKRTLGVDRIAACHGALVRYPDLTGRSFVVADFGSHTVMTLYRNGTILGGSIAAGIPLQLESIGGGLVLGPYILKLPRGFVGKSTEESIAVGTILGAVKGVEGLFERMGEEYEGEFELILTGGLSQLLRPFFRLPVRCDRQLIHYGAWNVHTLGSF